MAPKKSKTALCIQTDTLCNTKKFKHYDCDLFEITSDTPVENIHKCELLHVSLSGRMGCYVYPKDATIRFKTHHDSREMMKELKEAWELECKNNASVIRIQHLSVKTDFVADEEEEEEDDDEYDTENDEENEGEEDDKEEWFSDDELPSNNNKV